MQIRTRLTLLFLLIGGIIMIITSASIYYSSAKFRKEAFYKRLNTKSRSTAMLLLDANRIDAAQVKEIERKNPDKLYKEKIIIMNFANDIVYSTDDSSEIIIPPEIIEKISFGHKVEYRQGEYEVTGAYYYMRYFGIIVVAAAIDVEGFNYLEKLRTILILVLLLSLLLFFIAGWLYSGKALKPISDVVNKVENITITSLHLRVNEGNGKDEIGRLAKTFNRMLERLEASFAMQKDFIANASHELRTPLTSINGQLDVLLMKDRSPEDYKATIGSVHEDIKSLIDLSNRLLLIARTSAEGPVNFNKKIRIDEVLWQSREEIIKFNKKYKINIAIDSSIKDSDQMIIIGDDYLLKVALSNIIENGCKYSDDNKATVRLMRNSDNIMISIADNGIGISEKDIKKVFEPFYRGYNAINYKGTGIGLSLVNQIVNIHNGRITLSSIVGKGTTITLSFPIIITKN